MRDKAEMRRERRNRFGSKISQACVCMSGLGIKVLKSAERGGRWPLFLGLLLLKCAGSSENTVTQTQGRLLPVHTGVLGLALWIILCSFPHRDPTEEPLIAEVICSTFN